MAQHADAVAQQGAAGHRTRRVDGQHRDGQAALAQFADIGAGQGRLARAGRAGDPHHQCAARQGPRRPQHGGSVRIAVLDSRDGAGEAGPGIAAEDLDPSGRRVGHVRVHDGRGA